jgi:DNA polymerase (family 10)
MPRDRMAPLPADAVADPAHDAPPEPDDREAAAADSGDDEDDGERITNGRLARVFHEIGDMLEVKGELVYKTVAYHKAADAIAHTPLDVAEAYRRGDPPKIPGVGAAISEKIRELVETGHMAFYDRLRVEVPPALVELLRVPGVGPKTVRVLYETLGIENLEDLRHAAEAGHLRTVRGLSEKTEQSVLQGIAALEANPRRMLLGRTEGFVDLLLAELSEVPGLVSIQPAGSYRRRRETIGDIDLLAETTEPALLLDRFTTLASVDRVIGKGGHKAAVKLFRGPQVDLMVMEPGRMGAALIHFTGSKEHNVRLRGRARDRGWSLSEYGFVRLGADGEPMDLADPAADLQTFPTEADAYGFLDLPFIEPELREDRGEVEAALAGSLPRLITRADLRGDLHTHSEWSDGVYPIEAMAEACRRRGYEYQVLTDHSISLAIAHGLEPARVEQQRTIIARLNARFADEEARGDLPEGASARGFRLLHGCELEIRADGRLDYEDPLLARFDLVVASLHVSRRQPRAQLTERTLTAIHSPHVDVIAHPAGRMIQTRDDLDLDWETVYAEAARTGTALEINGSDHRLDLSDVRARRAAAVGCRLSVDSDAHNLGELDNVRWGIAMARRAWVEPSIVLNTWPREELLAWVAGKAARIAGGGS